MKVTALVVVLGLVAGALASDPEAVLTVQNQSKHRYRKGHCHDQVHQMTSCLNH